MPPDAPTIGVVEAGSIILSQRRRDAAQNIEDHEAHRPHRIFDIVAKNHKYEHVATDMHPAAMKKHGRDHGCPGRIAARPGGSGATPLAFAGTNPYW